MTQCPRDRLTSRLDPASSRSPDPQPGGRAGGGRFCAWRRPALPNAGSPARALVMAGEETDATATAGEKEFKGDEGGGRDDRTPETATDAGQKVATDGREGQASESEETAKGADEDNGTADALLQPLKELSAGGKHQSKGDQKRGVLNEADDDDDDKEEEEDVDEPLAVRGRQQPAVHLCHQLRGVGPAGGAAARGVLDEVLQTEQGAGGVAAAHPSQRSAEPHRPGAQRLGQDGLLRAGHVGAHRPEARPAAGAVSGADARAGAADAAAGAPHRHHRPHRRRYARPGDGLVAAPGVQRATRPHPGAGRGRRDDRHARHGRPDAAHQESVAARRADAALLGHLSGPRARIRPPGGAARQPDRREARAAEPGAREAVLHRLRVGRRPFPSAQRYLRLVADRPIDHLRGAATRRLRAGATHARRRPLRGTAARRRHDARRARPGDRLVPRRHRPHPDQHRSVIARRRRTGHHRGDQLRPAARPHRPRRRRELSASGRPHRPLWPQRRGHQFRVRRPQCRAAAADRGALRRALSHRAGVQRGAVGVDIGGQVEFLRIKKRGDEGGEGGGPLEGSVGSSSGASREPTGSRSRRGRFFFRGSRQRRDRVMERAPRGPWTTKYRNRLCMSERSWAAPRSEERYANRVVAWAGGWRGAWRPDRRNGRRRWDGCRTSRRSVAHAPIRARRKRYVRCCQWEPRNDAAPSKNVSVHTITDAHPPGGTVAEGNGVVRSPDTTAPPSAHILARQRTGTLSGREQLRVYGVDADDRRWRCPSLCPPAHRHQPRHSSCGAAHRRWLVSRARRAVARPGYDATGGSGVASLPFGVPGRAGVRVAGARAGAGAGRGDPADRARRVRLPGDAGAPAHVRALATAAGVGGGRRRRRSVARGAATRRTRRGVGAGGVVRAGCAGDGRVAPPVAVGIGRRTGRHPPQGAVGGARRGGVYAPGGRIVRRDHHRCIGPGRSGASAVRAAVLSSGARIATRRRAGVRARRMLVAASGVDHRHHAGAATGVRHGGVRVRQRADVSERSDRVYHLRQGRLLAATPHRQRACARATQGDAPAAAILQQSRAPGGVCAARVCPSRSVSRGGRAVMRVHRVRRLRGFDLIYIRPAPVESARPAHLALHRLFLPRNYPHTVADCYAAYAQWHFVHNALTACNAVLATTSLLFAAGLGRTDLSASAPAATVASIPVTAATLWVLKDGVGHLARLLYASRYGHAFDGDLKRFRMLGDVLWHAGTALELLCRLRPDWFLLLASGGNALKGMAHVVFSSTRSTIHRTLATASNIGDVTAKGDAQSIAAELLGIAGGIAVNHAIAEHGAATAWTAFTAVVAMQLVCRYQSMRVLVLPSLNFQRAVLLADAYVQAVLSGGGGDAEAAVPSPTEVAARERVLHWRTLWSPVRGIRPDVPLSAFDGESESFHRSASSLQRIWSACRRERFVVGRLSPSITPGLFPFGDRPRVGFAMKTDASATDTLRALMASLYLLRCPQATESEAIAAVAPPRTASFFARCHHLGWSLDVVHGFGHRNGVQCEAETNG
eukprot:ctg_1404.g422